MEEEKRKKKNRKKKNKLTKPTDDIAPPAIVPDTTASDDKDNVSKQNHGNETVDNLSQGQVAPDNGVDHISRGNGVTQIPQSNGAHLHNGTSVGPIAADGRTHNWVEKEARLQEIISQLQNDKDSGIQREAHLEMEIQQLQSEKSSWHYHEASLEQKMSRLLQEKAILIAEETNLQDKVNILERERLLWIAKENSSKEMIASLQDDNEKMRCQVIELEESRRNLMRENQQLRDNMTSLESQIQDVENTLRNAQSSAANRKDEAEIQELNSQLQASCALVDKLVTENADLVVKVNQLYIDIERRATGTEDPSAASSDAVLSSPDAAPNPDPMSEYSYDNALSGGSSKRFDGVIAEDETTVGDYMDSSETSMSGEIMQIPLDETEVEDVQAQGLVGAEEREVVPLTDAPLIGAPFRLISLVAKYVSGADLVNRSSLKSET